MNRKLPPFRPRPASARTKAKRGRRTLSSRFAVPESQPLHKLEVALVPSDPAQIVEWTRRNRNGYCLAQYLRLNRPVTTEIANLIDDILNRKFHAPILEPPPPRDRPEYLANEIKVTALLLQHGHARLEREAKALGHWPLESKREFTAAAWAIKAKQRGVSVRMLREDRWPQKGRGKRPR